MSLQRKLKRSFNIGREVKFPCPGCPATCTAGYTNPGNVPVLLHPEPICDDFKKDEPLDVFMERARLKATLN